MSSVHSVAVVVFSPDYLTPCSADLLLAACPGVHSGAALVFPQSCLLSLATESDWLAGVPGEHLAAIRADGLHLVTPDEDIVATIPASLVSSIDPPVSASDVVVIATKAQAAEQVIAELATAAAAAGLGSPAIVCCTNGVSVERTALRHFDRVYGVMVEMPGTQCDDPLTSFS